MSVKERLLALKMIEKKKIHLKFFEEIKVDVKLKNNHNGKKIKTG